MRKNGEVDICKHIDSQGAKWLGRRPSPLHCCRMLAWHLCVDQPSSIQEPAHAAAPVLSTVLLLLIP